MSLLINIFRFLIFRNVFIGLCSLALFQSTRLINHLPIELSPAAVFVISATVLYYNFHNYSHRFVFSSIPSLRQSLARLSISLSEKILYTVCFVGACSSMFFLSIPMLLVLMVLVVGSFFYSVPLISWKGKKVRIRESLYFKQLVLSVSWAIVTVVLPMLEEKIILMPGIVAAQFFSVVTFIYALCVPFEIRDMEREKLEGVQTIPVVYGTKVAKVLGVIALLIGSLMHLILFYENHISLYTLMALNISFLLTLFLMTFSARKPTDLYCKFYVDGLMIIQFLMVFVSLNLR